MIRIASPTRLPRRRPRAQSPRMVFALCALGLVSASIATTSARATQPNLAQCRDYDAEFDYTGVLTECGVAAGDPRTTPEERLEVYRLLGFAHTALGSPEKAQIWYLRLLAIDPTHTLGQDVSPRFRDGFAKAIRKFRTAGRVRASHAPLVVDAQTALDAPLELEVTVNDPLARVDHVVVNWRVDGGEMTKAQLTRGKVEGETTTFQGTLPAVGTLFPSGRDTPMTVDYQLVLKSLMDADVVSDPPLAPGKFEIRPRTVAAIETAAGPETGATTKTAGADDESDGMSATLIGVGVGGAIGAGLLVTAAVGGTIALYCLQNERCTSPAPTYRPSSSARVDVR